MHPFILYNCNSTYVCGILYYCGYCKYAAPTDVTCWEKLNDLLYLVARKCGWLDIIQGKLVGPHKLVYFYILIISCKT